jgi:hypothetical protein
MSNIYFFIGLTMISISVAMILTGMVNYISYWGEWGEWYDSLPRDGKSSYNQMKIMQSVMSNLKNRNR